MRETGEVDDAFTSVKDAVIAGGEIWRIGWVRSGGRVSRTHKIAVVKVSWGGEVNKAGRVAPSQVPDPILVTLHVGVNPRVAGEGAASPVTHDPHLDHGVHGVIGYHLGAARVALGKESTRWMRCS